ncbi:MAG TPA: c-type cytochrome [Terriglobia bacterium]|nr:c-type cytochrome [Terriglobia bacterium]
MNQKQVSQFAFGMLSVALLLRPPLALGRAQQKQASKTAPGIEGPATFRQYCAACHGLNGRGGEHAPDIVNNPKVRARSDRELVDIVTHGIPRAGMPAFNVLLEPAEVQAVVTYLRTLGGHGASVPVGGDWKLGEALFFGKAECSSCHMLSGKGGFLGADLSGYGRDHAPDEIRDAILHPASALSPDSGAATVTTRHGERLTGLVRNEDNFSIQLLDDQGRFHLLMKSELAAFERDPRSLMPSDYSSRLTAAEVNALVAYLASQGSRSTTRQDVKRSHQPAQPESPLKPGWKGP